jgi:exonuclease-1
MQALKRRGVEFIVAPYEADAQMAYLATNGLVDVVITEDSDLLTYGCPRVSCQLKRVVHLAHSSCGTCSLQPAGLPAAAPTLANPAALLQVFFKMDKSGEGEEVELKNLVHARELSFIGFTHDMFQEVRLRISCMPSFF